eukprot:TRINITY_DN8209_c0_g1_i4.p1 TRINITY_DN8209_c0_g1~~TRINITY_DN8209_c0_g1_i4.p1  ORF type:complete len:318 (+),score=51.19 TRINITY_DN8209_c0_g1_i4:37-954(+)
MEKTTNNSENYRFDINEDWETYLDKNGYVVIKSVASPEEVSKAIDLFWEHFSKSGVKRDDFSTWSHWGTDKRGIITNADVIQCAGAWYVRALPKVKAVFQKIWKAEDMIVSMDSLLLWKPWWLNSAWTPRTEGLHIDQNPFSKPDKCCVQGMVCLYEVTEGTGGLEVVPRSHTKESQDLLRATSPRLNGIGDFCIIMPRSKVITHRKLILAQPGDLILWDSRTIHGGKVGTGGNSTKENPVLARMSQTVCMLPRHTASKDVLEVRREGFEKGYGFSHWPNGSDITSTAKDDYKPIQLTPEQLALL